MTKRIVLAFGIEKQVIDPEFCDHANAVYFAEVDGDWRQCPDCGARIDADTGEVMTVASKEIPIFKEEL